MTEYEFTWRENNEFNLLANNMRIFAITLIVFGVLAGIVAGITEFDPFVVVIGIVLIGSGILFLTPLDNFRKIINTKGNDIEELLTALSELNRSWIVLWTGMFLLFLDAFIEFLGNV